MSSPRDPGVLTLAELRELQLASMRTYVASESAPAVVKTSVPQSKSKASSRSSPADDSIESRERRIAEMREEVKKDLSLRFTWKHGGIMLLGFLACYRAARLVGGSPAKFTAWILALTVANGLWRNRAPRRVTPDKGGQYRNYPIFGQIGALFQGLSMSFWEQQLLENKIGDYQSSEFVFFGNVREFNVMDPLDREYVLKTNWRNFTKNTSTPTSFDKMFPELLGRGIFAVDGDEWQDHRKIASNLFSANGLRFKMEASFVSHGRLLTSILERLMRSKPNPEEGIVLDWQDAMQAFTFETICDIAFGVEPGALEAALLREAKLPFLVAFDELQTDSVLRVATPLPVTYFLRVFQLGYEKRIFENGSFVRAYVSRIIQERLGSTSLETKEDLLSMYIRTSRSSAKPWMRTEEYLSDAVLNFMVAGRDTTSFTLTHLFELLAEHPNVVEKMLHELDDVVGRESDVSWDHLRRLPYCGAVFNEVLRLRPPVRFDFRIANEDDTLPSGLFIPKDSRVSFHNLAIGRDYHLWSRPEAFLPERWLDPEDPGRPVRRVDEYVHPVFFGGPRLCLGKDMARLEVLSVAYGILKNFQVDVIPNQSKRMNNGPISFYEQGLKARVTRRRAGGAIAP